MSTTLPHGIIQINEGNISWYGDITANWQLIDSKIGVYDAAIAAIPAPANNGRLTINYGGTTIAMFGADDAGNVTANIPAPGDGALTVTQGGSTLGTFSANQAAPETIDIPAPGDGTLTIQLNGSDVQTFTANQSGNVTANIQCPAVNDGTLTIQQNGTTVDTFTANSSSDKTVNIQCVDLTSNQTVGGIKTFSNAPVVGSIDLDGKSIDTDANGNMTYDGHIVDTIEEQGDGTIEGRYYGYIRYSSGIQICWGYVSAGAAVTQNFPKSFSQLPSISITCDTSNTDMMTTATSTPQAVTVYNRFDYYGSFYIAIGKWK